VNDPGATRPTTGSGPSPRSLLPRYAWSLAAVVACVGFAVFITWPQAAHMSTHVAAHQDPYFSLWRLEWIAHALRTDPRTLFDGNIFYPTRNTLAYSDAMLLEGVIAAPLLWSGVSPFITYNLLLIGAIAASGVGMFVLVRHLTGSGPAALIAAAVFTMAPYRIEHFMHLELQWTMWMPLTFWAVHRAVEAPSWRRGGLVGLFLWLQIISGVYYGVFLAIATAALVALLLVAQPRRTVRALPALLAGGAIASMLAAPYLWPYVKAIQTLGGRSPDEIARYSAHASSYLASPPQNWLLGWTNRWGGVEVNLFPGLTACVLGVIAFTARPRRDAVVYALLAALMIALSFGVNGTLYSWLAGFLPGLRGLRAPARFGILASATIAVLAGAGVRALEQRISSPGRLAGMVVVITLLMSTEYANTAMQLMPQGDPEVTPLYRVVRSAPPGVVVELPLPLPSTMPGWEADYVFWSTAHWKPLVNGYSGYAPVAYVMTLERMRHFPDDQSIATLRGLDVRYVIVHKEYYDPAAYTALMLAVAARPELRPYGRYRGPGGDGDLFLLEPQ
jgi:hypothetical protein